VGNLFITLGVVLVLIGVSYKFGLLNWFGNLPLDVKYQGENVSFFAPIGSMLVISLITSLLLWLFNE